MTDGWNCARSVNRKLIATIKKYASNKANTSDLVGLIILDAIDAAAASDVNENPNPAEDDVNVGESLNPAEDEDDSNSSM